MALLHLDDSLAQAHSPIYQPRPAEFLFRPVPEKKVTQCRVLQPHSFRHDRSLEACGARLSSNFVTQLNGYPHLHDVEAPLAIAGASCGVVDWEQTL